MPQFADAEAVSRGQAAFVGAISSGMLDLLVVCWTGVDGAPSSCEATVLRRKETSEFTAVQHSSTVSRVIGDSRTKTPDDTSVHCVRCVSFIRGSGASVDKTVALSSSSFRPLRASIVSRGPNDTS